MSTSQEEQLKSKIQEKSIQHLDSLLYLLPENKIQAELILQLMSELVKEKKLNPRELYKRMEEPLFFQDESGQDFTKVNPLIVKLIRDGGLSLFNYYLNFKYGSPLSTELLALHDIFSFRLEPIIHYFNKTNELVIADKEDKARITEKYYSVYGLSYELLGDILQEKNRSILKRLVECQFDFNKQSALEHLKKYFYVHFDNHEWINEEILQFLLNNGLHPNSYLELFITGFLDGHSIPHLTKKEYPLIQAINLLLDYHATLSQFSHELLEKLQQLLEMDIEKMTSLPGGAKSEIMLEEMWYLQAHLVESMQSFDAAKPYYSKAGVKGVHAITRKELVHLLQMVKSLS